MLLCSLYFSPLFNGFVVSLRFVIPISRLILELAILDQSHRADWSHLFAMCAMLLLKLHQASVSNTELINCNGLSASSLNISHSTHTHTGRMQISQLVTCPPPPVFSSTLQNLQNRATHKFLSVIVVIDQFTRFYTKIIFIAKYLPIENKTRISTNWDPHQRCQVVFFRCVSYLFVWIAFLFHFTVEFVWAGNVDDFGFF